MANHRAHSRERGPKGGGCHEIFGNREVLNALSAVFVRQAGGCSEDAGRGVHQLAENNDLVAQVHGLVGGFPDCFRVGDLSLLHGSIWGQLGLALRRVEVHGLLGRQQAVGQRA